MARCVTSRQVRVHPGPVLEELVAVPLRIEIQVGHVPSLLPQVDSQVHCNGGLAHPALAEGDHEHAATIHGSSLRALLRLAWGRRCMDSAENWKFRKLRIQMGVKEAW